MSKEPQKRTLDPSTPVHLGAMVDYAEASIVSRILAKNSAGNVTLFSFDQGQSLSEHSTPFDALVQVIEGKVELVIGGKPLTAKAGEVVLMPANIPHAVNAAERFKMLLIMLKGT